MPEEDKFGFADLKKNIDVMKKELPLLLANDAQNYFSKSFLNQSWEGKQWQEVQRRIPGTNSYKYPKKKDLGRHTRPILVGKGSTKLRRAVANSARLNPQVWPIVRLVVDLPYARAHNEGLGKMPKRKYMGDSKELNQIHKKRIIRTIAKLNKK